MREQLSKMRVKVRQTRETVCRQLVTSLLQVLVVINAGGFHVYRLGGAPLLLSTFNFETLVSWQSMNDMLIINIIYTTKMEATRPLTSMERSAWVSTEGKIAAIETPSIAVASHARVLPGWS